MIVMVRNNKVLTSRHKKPLSLSTQRLWIMIIISG